MHVIEAGDWLGALAERYGLSHGARIWADPGNEKLRALRGSPDLLMVGDELVVPDGTDDEHVEVPAGSRAVFVVRSQRDMLRVRIVGMREFLAAFGSVDYELRTTEDAVQGRITEDGQILELPLSSSIARAELVLGRNTTVELAIGGLGPVEESRAAFDRLEALSYVAEVVADDPDDDEQQAVDPLATALRSFQLDHGLPVTGELDDATQRALADEYGT